MCYTFSKVMLLLLLVLVLRCPSNEGRSAAQQAQTRWKCERCSIALRSRAAPSTYSMVPAGAHYCCKAVMLQRKEKAARQPLHSLLLLLLVLPLQHLFLILALILCNVEVAQLVGVPVFVVCNDAEPVAHVVLLQVLLCQVLEVALGHVLVAGDGDL